MDVTISLAKSSRRKTFPNLQFETPLWQAGLSKVAGMDEAGRGALAGPVAVGVVILPVVENLPTLLIGVRDSKLMSPRARQFWAERIHGISQAWGVGFSTNEEIDRLGILPATYLAASRAIEQLSIEAEYLLLDYLVLRECALPQTAIVKGDLICLSIAAASILAKTARDAVMRDAEIAFPGYGFSQNKGYGTSQHRLALSRIGPSSFHRMTFDWKPVPDSIPII